MIAPLNDQKREPTRVVILGGGFGGVYTALHLERLTRKLTRAGREIEITLLSEENYFLMTPFLFEAGSGVLEPRHAVTPIRRLLKQARFVEGELERVDFTRQVVYARHARAELRYELPYDQLVLALGSVTSRNLIPGSEYALGFKSLADAIFLRNHTIDLFEQAEVETDAERKAELLTFVIIGGGLVGVELVGELTSFVGDLCRVYHHVRPEEVRFYLLDASKHLLPELDRGLAAYAARQLRRRGVQIRTCSPVQRIEPTRVWLPKGPPLHTRTIILAAGVMANPLLADMPLTKDRRGRVIVEATMRSPEWPNVWALGDCAAIPDPTGQPYPTLAQHALREAKVLAANIVATIGGGGTIRPFVYKTLGTLAALGHYSGVGRIMSFRVRGFLAWWIWRTYYLFQMPRWDRRIRVMLDWTVALFFRHDIVKLDLFGREHPLRQQAQRTEEAAPRTERLPTEQIR